jgi:hypothetical protein
LNSNEQIKVGLISCSGEEIPEGTLSRVAVRLVLEKLRPNETVTICLPLFLAGDGGERGFAKRFPTIVVDGCSKFCARDATEKYSGKVDDVIIVKDFLESIGAKAPASRRDLSADDFAVAWKLAEEISRRVEKVLRKAENKEKPPQNECCPPVATCACMSGGSKPFPVNVSGKTIEINGLVNIVKMISSKKGTNATEIMNELIKQVQIYNGPMEDVSEKDLKIALFREYKKICSCLNK